MKKINFLIIIPLILYPINIFCNKLPVTVVNICIIKNVNHLNVTSNDRFFIIDLTTGLKYEQLPTNHEIELYKNYIKVSETKFLTNMIQIIPKTENNFIYVNKKPYRDIIYIRKINNKLSVINEVGIENYIYGILKMETNPEWPLEVLKAQAVVSRTYAVKRIGRHQEEGFDFCSEVHCQVYRGVNGEDKRTNYAVDLTKGEVLTYKNQLADTVYHACCGGRTENPENVWSTYQQSPEYLKGVICKYCKSSKHYRWEKIINEELLIQKLNNSGYKIDKLLSIKIYSKSKTGRAKEIAIKYIYNNNRHTLVLLANRFRLIVDPWQIKSTNFVSIIKQDKKYIFSGKGWGHGVGMCQEGAKVMADKGYDYRQILEYYYPGTEIQKWEY